MPPKKKAMPVAPPVVPTGPFRKLTPKPMQVMAPVATQTQTNVALGTLMICCVALLAAFGAQMMAGIVRMSAMPEKKSDARIEATKNIDIQSGQWVYVYGPDKNMISNFNALSKLIESGADVKVFVGQDYKTCEDITTASLDNDIMIVCRVSTLISPDKSTPPAGDAVQYEGNSYRINRIALNSTVNMNSMIKIYDGGKVVAGQQEITREAIKWFVKK